MIYIFNKYWYIKLMILFLNIVILIASLSLLFYLQQIHISFNKRVLIGLLLGTCLGSLFHIIYSPQDIKKAMEFYDIIGVGYIRFLQMLVFPVIIVSILSAMTKIGENNSLIKSLLIIIAILLFTTGISACIGIATTLFFKIDLGLLNNIILPQNFLSTIDQKTTILNKTISSLFTDFITTNPFLDLTGYRGSSIASIVIFLIMIGFAYLGVKKKEPLYAEKFKNAIDVLYKITMRLVVLILRLTPYGIFALFCKIISSSDYLQILSLLKFILISYIAIFIMFIVHSLLLLAFGFNIIIFYKKVFSLLLFAFSSRSSVASIPLNINTQTHSLGVNSSVASSSASFGAILGQNGCAGIYPAMLATCVAPIVGINPFDLHFLSILVLTIIVSSFGIAGVGGGATFAAISVLSSFNMPLGIIALLVGIEPLIDMARTALNVNGSLVASLLSSKITKQINMEDFNNKKLENNIKNDL